MSDRLEDDDYDLLEENLGIKFQRKKFKRLRRIVEDDSDDGNVAGGLDDREVIANQLFEGSDNDEHTDSHRQPVAPQYRVDDSSEESEVDDFIVDDDGRPLNECRRQRPIYSDAALETAQDIFGVEFDYDTFAKVKGREEDSVDGEELPETHKVIPIHEYFEPYELEEAGLSVNAKKIWEKDAPERHQLRNVPVTSADPKELDEEAEWIYKVAFSTRLAVKSSGAPTAQDTPADTEWADDWDKQSAFPAPPRTFTNPVPARTTTLDQPTSDESDEEESSLRNAGWNDNNSQSEDNVETSIKPKKTSGEPTEEDKQQLVPKIRKTLALIRNNSFEVPFIAFYRKEMILPDLSTSDLWTIYKLDARFCQLRIRKNRLLELIQNLKEYLETLTDETIRPISEEDFGFVKNVTSSEEYDDVNMFFNLHYKDEITGMKIYKQKQQEGLTTSGTNDCILLGLDDTASTAPQMLSLPNDTEVIAENSGIRAEDNGNQTNIHRVGRGGAYGICKKTGIGKFLPCFGMTADALANNLYESYSYHEVNQVDINVIEAAKEVCCERMQTSEEVLKAAKFMMATQIARHPVVRRVVRKVFFERATVSCCPTNNGRKEIDEAHPCYSLKYLMDKPLKTFEPLQFIKLVMAEKEGLMIINLGDTVRGDNEGTTYTDDVKQFFRRDEFSKNVLEWNALRSECIDLAFDTILYPELRKELKEKLIQDDKEHILKCCCEQLYHWLKIAPYKVSECNKRSENEWNSDDGVRVVALAYGTSPGQISFACSLSAKGEPTGEEFIQLPNIMKNRKSTNEDEKMKKAADLKRMKEFISYSKPHVIVVAGESRESLGLQRELKEVVSELIAEEGFPEVAVEIVDNQLGKVYSGSNKMAEFSTYPLLLKEAISLGRKIQDPLLEFCQLCNSDDEILCLKFHELQEQVSKEELLDRLQIEFINRTNEVGVDVVRAAKYKHTSGALQFICGLGRKKADGILKLIRQGCVQIESRYQFLSLLGGNVWHNCSGFIKFDLDPNNDPENSDVYVEVLDTTRIHPESYEMAISMAKAALNKEPTSDSSIAIQEIMAAPVILQNLDLDKLEKEHVNFDKKITLQCIIAELTKPYEDYRENFKSPDGNELFEMLTKVTPYTVYIGKLVTATVTGVWYKKPDQNAYAAATPIRTNSGLWQCVFCHRSDFDELTDVWRHFDLCECPGQVEGIKISLDNGITGFIQTEALSDNQVKHPDERVCKGQAIYCRVVGINPEKFIADCTCRTTDLHDTRDVHRPKKDDYYDKEREEQDLQKDKEEAAVSSIKKQHQGMLQHILVHPSFKKMTYADAEAYLDTMDQGDAIVRPSSKGKDNLAVSWKVADGVIQHINVVVTEKKETTSAANYLFYIGCEEYEDLDEILARHVIPMASHAKEIIENRFFVTNLLGNRQAAEAHLLKLQKTNSKKIHYAIHASKDFPGKFLLSYLPTHRSIHEFITVTPDGMRFRQQSFDSIKTLLPWFKEHYKDTPPAHFSGLTPNPPSFLQRGVGTRVCPPPPGRSIFSTMTRGPKQTHTTTPHYKTPIIK